MSSKQQEKSCNSYSNVFHPCSVCLSIADGQKRPKPLYGSKVSKRRGSSSFSTNTTMRSSARESTGSDLVDEPGLLAQERPQRLSHLAGFPCAPTQISF